jgi:arabinofuranosyltransferase
VRQDRIASALMMSAALLAFAFFCVRSWPIVVDDAYIIFRYSRNLAAGFGLAWDPGAAPVEGYTSFLWVMIMAVPFSLHLDPVIFAKVLGIVCAVLYMALTVALILELFDGLDFKWPLLMASAGALFLGCELITALHAVTGMETALFTLLFTAFIYLVTMAVSRPVPRIFRDLALCSLLLGLCRPEGNLVAMLGLAAAFMVLGKKAGTGLVKAAAVYYVLPGLAYFIWRLAYFHVLFPLPFYLKVGGQRGLPGLYFVATYIFRLALFSPFALVAFIWGGRRFLPAAWAMAGFIVFFLFPAHIMGYLWRYLVPATPAVLAFSAVGLAVVLARLQARLAIRSERAALPAAAVVAVLAVFTFGRSATGDLIQFPCASAAQMEQAHVALGKYLASFPAPSGPPLLSILDAGAVAYYSKWRVIDTFGLNDPHIALSGRREPGYVLDRRPDLIIIRSSDPEKFAPMKWDSGLYGASQEKGYARAKVVELHQGYYLWIMAVPGTAVSNYMKAWTCAACSD